MQKHPMVSVKEAAAALGCDERWVREKLNQGQLKGEKKTIGMKEKWFVYKGEIDAAVAKRGNSVTPEAIDQQYFGVADEVVDAVEANQDQSNELPANASITEIVRAIANEFADKLNEEKRVNLVLQSELEQKDRQLRLLPDLQKQAEDEHKAAEMQALEVEALKKQIAAMEEQRQDLEARAGQASELASDLQALKSKVEELQKPWWRKLFEPGTPPLA